MCRVDRLIMYNIKETSLSASFSTWLVHGRTSRVLNDYVIFTYSNDKDLPELRRSVLEFQWVGSGTIIRSTPWHNSTVIITTRNYMLKYSFTYNYVSIYVTKSMKFIVAYFLFCFLINTKYNGFSSWKVGSLTQYDNHPIVYKLVY